MDTKSFVNQLNQITDALLTMTPAQRGVVITFQFLPQCVRLHQM